MFGFFSVWALALFGFSFDWVEVDTKKNKIIISCHSGCSVVVMLPNPGSPRVTQVPALQSSINRGRHAAGIMPISPDATVNISFIAIQQ